MFAQTLQKLRSYVGGLAVAVFFACLSTSASAQDLGGTYRGLDQAQGISIHLIPSGTGFSGQIVAGSGREAKLDLRPIPGGARGPLTLKGQSGTVELLAQPVGLSMVWRPDVGGEELIYAFRHERLALPTLPPGYRDPPPPGADRINPIDFLISYEFWEAAQVARAYDGLDDKYRALMKSFSTVHTDMLWKLCRAPVAPDQLTEALRGEGVTCVDVQRRIKDSQRDGAFMNFKRAVHREKADVLTAVECARGINTADVCARAAQRTQQASLALETVGSILSRF